MSTLQLHDVDESRASAARYLITSVTKQTLASTESALDKLISSHYTGLGRFVMSSVMSSALSDRTINEDRLALLKAMIIKALEKENASTLLADIFETSGTVYQSADAIQELIQNQLNLTRAQQVQFAVALNFMTGSDSSWRDVAQQLLVRLLDRQSTDEVRALFPAGLENRIFQLALAAAQIPALRSLSDSLCVAPILIPSTEAFSTYEESFSIAKVIEELGPSCLSSLEDSKELLSIFPSPLSERSIAELLCLIASPSLLVAHDTNAYNALRVSMGMAESRTSNAAVPLQTNIVVQAIKESIGGNKDSQANRELWNRVMLSLDHPSMRVERFATIAAAYKKGTNEQLPVSLFLNDPVKGRKWRNVAMQGAALKFALDNPELVGREALNVNTKGMRVLPKEITTPDDVSDLWRFELFVDSATTVSMRERDLDAAIAHATAKAPAAMLAALMACPTPTVRHYVLASHALKASSHLHTVVTDDVVRFLTAESCIPSLVGLLSEFAQADSTRVFEIAELCVKHGLTDAVLKCSSSTRLMVEVALVSKESSHPCPDKWVEQALSDVNRSRPNQAFSKFSVASSILEAADDLLTRQRCISSASAALQALIQSPIAPSIPGIVLHAKQLVQGENYFSPDVEEEATQFFNRIYNDDTIAPMSLIDRLHRSGNARDKQVLACIVNILFDETRSLSDYPWKQLQTAARLFGQLINSDVLGPARLQQALRLLLPTILKQSDMKTYEYGIIALEQFKLKLLEWPVVGKQLKSVSDLDMRIPGVVGLINIGIQKAVDEDNAAAAAAGASSAGGAGGSNAAAAAGTTAPGLHQLDIRILMDKSSNYSLPPSVVQDQINFLVGNTDPSNLDTNAAELATLLKPEFYSYFADYLVVKRVSLEPNFHRMYLQLVEKINSRELEKRIRTATVNAVKRLLGSDKIRTDTSERSLLKNLGSWFGGITLAKNIPVLSRDMDFKDLLYQGLREGKLIAVVPFVAKVLDQCINSRYFRPPNPWTLAQLGHLYEMYRLPDLKLTLRFEVEVLCKNISISVAEVEEVTRAMYPTTNGVSRRGVTMLEIRSQLDVSGSTDFRVEEAPRQESPPPRPRSGLQADAPPYQPRSAPPVEIQPPPRPPVVITSETVRAGDELSLLPQTRHQAYHQALVKTLEPALKEVQAHVERASVIAAYSAKEIVLKDFARDPDGNLLRRAGQAMARSLASNLCTAIVKEHLWTALRKHLQVLAQHLTDVPNTRNDITEKMANNNFELCIRFLEYQSNELAGRKVDELLTAAADEKAIFVRKNEPLPIPADQVNLQPLLSTLPEALRPSGPMPAIHRQVYEEFYSCVPVVEQLSHLIRAIEEAAIRHYQAPNAEYLSLTNPLFTEKQLSDHHVTIRTKLVEVAHLITPETAVQLISFVFQRLMDITENLTRIEVNRPETKPLVSTTQLLNEVFLFVIQSTNEKGKDKALGELTRCYLAHERRWKYCDIVVNFMRLRVIDVSKLDEALSKALQETSQQQQGGAPTNPNSRNIVEFAGQVIQKVLIDDKLATTKDLQHTLHMLEQIARSRQAAAQQQHQQQQQQQQSMAAVQQLQQQPVVAPQQTLVAPKAATVASPTGPAAPAPLVAVAQGKQPVSPGAGAAPAPQSPYPSAVTSIRLKSMFPPERRTEIQPLFDEWISICLKKAQPTDAEAAAAAPSGDSKSAAAAPPAGGAAAEQTQILSMQFVKKLQNTNMLLTDKNQLDAFIGILIELSVEHFATKALELERSSGSVAQLPMPKGVAPPHRFPFQPDLFQRCDAFSDLVVLLVRCCSWSQNTAPANAQTQENTARAEVALVGRVLQVAMRVLQHNHEAVQNNSNSDAPALNIPDAAYQKIFLQQPYVRILSNLLIAIHRNHGDATITSSADAPATTTEDILRFFSETLRNTCPLKAPAFTFGWLELVSHRLFVVRMLKNKKLWPNYIGLLCEALRFIDFFTKGSAGVASNVLVFTKSFLKLMLILLHDFPEFVLSCHVQLCDAIPPCCVQLRNVVLCAFPPNIKLPDPFAQNLHIDRLPEMMQPPPIQDAHRRATFTAAAVTPEELSSFVNGTAGRITPRIVVEALRNANGRWNVSLINAVVLHTACAHLALTQNAIPPTFADSPALELFREMTKLLDNEGRYYFLNACVNHLRYPNCHTHYFSQVILHLFLPQSPQHVAQLASHQELIQEQITRVLVERLIISRPHPWGLLITFIELIKNKRYLFWDKGFIRCTPEIEKMFENLLRSISGNAAAAAAAAAAAVSASSTAPGQ